MQRWVNFFVIKLSLMKGVFVYKELQCRVLEYWLWFYFYGKMKYKIYFRCLGFDYDFLGDNVF